MSCAKEGLAEGLNGEAMDRRQVARTGGEGTEGQVEVVSADGFAGAVDGEVCDDGNLARLYRPGE